MTEINSPALLSPYHGDSPKIEIVDSSDPTMLTLIFHEEDHTIGNSLKHVMCQMPDVEFCGYSVPHPLEDKILLRVQTKEGVSAASVVVQALRDLEAIFKGIGRKFQSAYAASKS